jgi:hypothetical protein
MRPPNCRRQELIWAFARATRIDIEIENMRGYREIAAFTGKFTTYGELCDASSRITVLRNLATA